MMQLKTVVLRVLMWESQPVYSYCVKSCILYCKDKVKLDSLLDYLP